VPGQTVITPNAQATLHPEDVFLLILESKGFSDERWSTRHWLLRIQALQYEGKLPALGVILLVRVPDRGGAEPKDSLEGSKQEPHESPQTAR